MHLCSTAAVFLFLFCFAVLTTSSHWKIISKATACGEMNTETLSFYKQRNVWSERINERLFEM